MAEEKTAGIKTLFQDAVVPKASGEPPSSAEELNGCHNFPKRTGGKLREINRTIAGGLPGQD